jgi:hypothetical protein
MRLSERTDQGGRLDGMQLMVHRNYAYVGHVHRNKRGHRCPLMVRMLRHTTDYADMRPGRLGQRLAAVDPQCHTGHEGVGHREQHRAGNVVGSYSTDRVVGA